VDKRAPGRVVTFYSFKGGTGRSMALANIATTIAQRNGGTRVLAVDWDLEAPGLHRYFRPYLKLAGFNDRDAEIDSHPGLIEFLIAARARAESQPPNQERNSLLTSAFEPASLGDYILPTDIPQLSLMKAGRFDSERAYQSAINTFDWDGLFDKQPMFFGALADYLASNFDYVLIDSRTGYTDISGICTSLLPDTLVAVFTPNRQSISGAALMVRQAVTYRAKSDDLRPLRAYPLASRVELSELRLNDSWRFGDDSEEIRGYQPEFESLFNDIYGIDGCNLTSYFDEAQVPYVPYYAFGERVAVRSEESATIRLSRSYALLTDMIQSPSPLWEYTRTDRDKPERSDLETLPAVPWDMDWIQLHHSRAMDGLRLRAKQKTAFMEVRFSLSRVKASSSRRQLLEATRDVGADMSLNSPKAFGDGIFWESREAETVYDYWALRGNGDFFRVGMFPDGMPKPGVIHVMDLVVSVTRSLLFCQRLYGRMGITPRAEVRFFVGIFGIKDHKLAVPAEVAGGWYERSTAVDQEAHEIEIVVGRVESDLIQYVKSLAEPLLEVFEFASLTDREYEEIGRQVWFRDNPQSR
jgi:hypothetical protein